MKLSVQLDQHVFDAGDTVSGACRVVGSSSYGDGGTRGRWSHATQSVGWLAWSARLRIDGALSWLSTLQFISADSMRPPSARTSWR